MDINYPLYGPLVYLGVLRVLLYSGNAQQRGGGGVKQKLGLLA